MVTHVSDPLVRGPREAVEKFFRCLGEHLNVRLNPASGHQARFVSRCTMLKGHPDSGANQQRGHIENIPKTARMATCRAVTTAGTPKTSAVTGQALMQTDTTLSCSVWYRQCTAPRGADTILQAAGVWTTLARTTRKILGSCSNTACVTARCCTLLPKSCDCDIHTIYAKSDTDWAGLQSKTHAKILRHHHRVRHSKSGLSQNTRHDCKILARK